MLLSLIMDSSHSVSIMGNTLVCLTACDGTPSDLLSFRLQISVAQPTNQEEMSCRVIP
jgi:hypothetical protein